MKFGPCQVDDALGTILAHSVLAGTRRIKKGTVLNNSDIEDLRGANVKSVTVAYLAPDDVHEDAAALKLAEALVGDSDGVNLSVPFTGRVNIYAECDGLFRVDAAAIEAFNAVDPSITVATLADYQRIRNRSLVATVKIIPFATSQKSLEIALAAGSSAINISPFAQTKATLILTELPGAKQSLRDKGINAIANRMNSMGCTLENPIVVPHSAEYLLKALKDADSDLVLILTASATSDVNDVGPSALRSAGGTLTRFGMPVDPGNLLFLGKLAEKTIVGLPGCVRSPALNGADWVLERLACKIEVTNAELAGMGVGGLLKEIPTRTQPRSGPTRASSRPHVEVILLAAGASSRMQGVDKLMENIEGEPLLRRSARVVKGAKVDGVIVVLPPDRKERFKSLSGLSINIVEAPDWQDGMAASIRAGMGAISQQTDAVLIALADMPDVTADHLDALIAAFDPSENREICRPISGDGTPGNPVLFGRRFFETLGTLVGDHGGRDIISHAQDFLINVPTTGQSVSVDLDTPKDWANWRTIPRGRD